MHLSTILYHIIIYRYEELSIFFFCIFQTFSQTCFTFCLINLHTIFTFTQTKTYTHTYIGMRNTYIVSVELGTDFPLYIFTQ